MPKTRRKAGPEEGLPRDRVHRAGADEARYADAESRLVIYQGATAYQLGEMFGMSAPNVMRRLEKCPPTGLSVRGTPIWRINIAAAYLLDLNPSAADIDAYMARTNPKDMPAAVNKAYWDAMQAKLRYGERASELWTTTEVIETAAAVFQSLAFSLRLIADELREAAGLNEAQFKLVQSIVDTALEQAHDDFGPNLRKPRDGRPRATAENGAVQDDL